MSVFVPVATVLVLLVVVVVIARFIERTLAASIAMVASESAQPTESDIEDATPFIILSFSGVPLWMPY